jgi:uncharacterized protein YndB with AHSA1/START domain
MNNDFTTTITVDAPVHEVYNAINNVKGWWHGAVEGDTDKVNDEFTYRWQDIHYSKQRVTELVPDKKVAWLVTDSALNFTKDKSEWTDTHIIFELQPEGDKTTLRFTHQGLKHTCECYDACSNGWTSLIHKSLPSLVANGKGMEVF